MTFFTSLTNKLFTGAILALVVALGITMIRANAISNDREKLRNSLATANANHAVTLASLNALEQELADMVHRGELRASRLADAMREAQAQSSDLRAEAALIEAQGVDETCRTPRAILNSEGL